MQIGALPCWAIKPGQSARPKAIKTLERSMTLPFVIYKYIRTALLSIAGIWKIGISAPPDYRGAPVFSSTPEAHPVNGAAVIQKIFSNSLAAPLYLSSVGADLRCSLVSIQGLALWPEDSVRYPRADGIRGPTLAKWPANWLRGWPIPRGFRVIAALPLRASASKLAT
jgi:hypothetical protein